MTGSKDVLQQDIDEIIHYHVLLAAGTGAVPLPLLDLLALTGIHVNMIRELAELYGEPFQMAVFLKVMGAIIGKNFFLTTGPELVASLIKVIPGVGKLAGALSMPVLGGAATYATGKVMARHFASEGTLLDFAPQSIQTYYRDMFEEGKQIVAELKHKKDRPS